MREMNNKVNVTNPLYQRAKTASLILFIFAALSLLVLFTFRAMDTRNYNGRVKEVSGVVISIEDNDDTLEIKLSNNVVYSANRIRTSQPEFDFEALLNTEVTFYLPETQVGINIPPWIVGIKQGDITLIDYNEVIADGKAEAKIAMIVTGILSGAFAACVVALFLWRLRIGPVKEGNLYEAFCELERQRQPSCPQYKHLGTAVISYLFPIIIVSIVIPVVCSAVENVAVQIAVTVVMSVLFVGSTAALLIFAHRLTKKEHEFYAQNFPFDLDDISHFPAVGKQKKRMAELQTEVREERKKYPHRYFDAGNGYMVDFTENGVEFFHEEDDFPTPDADFVFGEDGENSTARQVYKLNYQQLSFEALPYYRKKDHPLTVVIKSRIVDCDDVPEEMTNDFHFMLDSNLLATLCHFNVQVENLQFILENKAQLIEENCQRRTNKNK